MPREKSRSRRNGRHRSQTPKPKYTHLSGSSNKRFSSLLPTVGLIFPYKNRIMRSYKADRTIKRILWEFNVVNELGRAEVEPIFADIFERARDFIKLPDFSARVDKLPAGFPVKDLKEMRDPALMGGETHGGDVLPVGSISMLYGLHQYIRRGEGSPTRRLLRVLSFKGFATLFLTLRSARAWWLRAPRYPKDPTTHSILPTTISKFLQESKTIEWGGLEMILWLRDGAMWLDPSGGIVDKDNKAEWEADGNKRGEVEAGDHGGPAADANDDDDKNVGDIAMEDAEAWEEDPMNMVVKMMEDLELDVNWAALARVFKGLSLGN